LWRARAEFVSDAGGDCGLTIEPFDEGHGLISLYYDSNTSAETRLSFESYVLSHVKSRSVPDTVSATYVHRCPECLESLTDRQIAKRIERGFTHIVCPICEFGNISLCIAGQTTAALDRKIRELDNVSDKAKYIETAKMTVKDKEAVGEYDVFLCYNWDDKKFVYQLYDQLIADGLRPWLDNREIRPGTSWQDSLENVIMQVRSAAVLVGKSGVGPWQEQEVRSLLHEFAGRQAPVIPALLPNAGSCPDLPMFLRNLSWVDFREDREKAFRARQWGITGRRI
jgi:TIR domain